MINRLDRVRQRADRRRHRIKTVLKKQPNQRPRLSVHISQRHIRAQVIDDSLGQTLVAVSTVGWQGAAAKAPLTKKATKIGDQIGQTCLKQKIEAVNFDRGRRLYHGRVKALAEAARAQGLKF